MTSLPQQSAASAAASPLSAPKTQGPASAKHWVILVATAVLGTELFAVLAAFVLPGTAGVLVAVTAAAWLAGRLAGVKGLRWWSLAWAIAFVGTATLNIVLLLVFASQVEGLLS